MEEIIKRLNEYTGVNEKYKGYVVWYYKKNKLTVRDKMIFWLDIDGINIMTTKGQGRGLRLQLL